MKNVKKYLAFLLVMVLLAGAVVAGTHLIPTNADAASYKMGDVDGDGEVSAGDARLALRAAVGLETLEGLKFTKADVDKDGEISASDARTILRMAVGLEKEVVVNDEEQTTQPAEEDTTFKFVPTNEQPEVVTNPEGYVDYTQVCRYCGRDDCKSLPKYNDWTVGLDYLCPEYDMTKDPNPDYTKVCRYCGKTDCPALQPNEDGSWNDVGKKCPMYDEHKDPNFYCEKCGYPTGAYGPNNCKKFIRDVYCPVCGQFLHAFECHHCQGNSEGFDKIYDIDTGKLTN